MRVEKKKQSGNETTATKLFTIMIVTFDAIAKRAKLVVFKTGPFDTFVRSNNKII